MDGRRRSKDLAEGSYVPHEWGEEIASVRRETMSRRVSRHILQGYDASELLSDVQGNIKQIIELSHYYTDKIGLVKTAIRIYITLTDNEITLVGGSKKNKNYFNKLIDDLELNEVLRQSIPDIYKSGNIFWYRETEGKQTVWLHQLNPIDVEVKGHRRGRPVALLNTTSDPNTLPNDLKNVKDTSRPLNEKKLYQVSADREGYLRYGKPFTTATFLPIQHIEELLDMESDSIDSVVDSLMIVTIGDEKRPATQKQVQELKEVVKNLKQTSRIVGNHTLKADVKSKDTSVFNAEKFQVPMEMLMRSLGITPSLFTGEGSTNASVLGMQSATRIIESARKELEHTLNKIFKDIANEVGLDYKNNPKVSLGKLDLNDDEIAHKIMRELYLDSVLSAESYVKAHGYDYNIEKERMNEEDKDSIVPRPMSSTMSGTDYLLLKNGEMPNQEMNPMNNNQNQQPNNKEQTKPKQEAKPKNNQSNSS